MIVRSRLIALGIGFVAVLVAAVIVPFAPADDWLDLIPWTLGPVLFTSTGGAILARSKGNFVGWSLVAVGLGTLLEGLGHVALREQPADPTLIHYVALVLVNVMFLFTFFVPVHLFYVFPTGRLLSRRWLWEPVLLGAVVAAFAVGGVLSYELTHPIDGWSVPNPLGIGLLQSGESWGEAVFGGAVGALVVGGPIALILRYFRSGAVVRAQIKWILYAAVLFAVSSQVNIQAFSDSALRPVFAALLESLGYVAIAGAVTMAITRHRLYEIDRLISRSVVYAAVVAVLAGLYFGLLYLLGTVLPFESDLAVAASTLGVVAVFNPVRRRVQGFVDRRFFRSRYDAVEVVRSFVGRISGPMDGGQLVEELEGVLDTTMRPEAVGVWIRGEK